MTIRVIRISVCTLFLSASKSRLNVFYYYLGTAEREKNNLLVYNTSTQAFAWKSQHKNIFTLQIYFLSAEIYILEILRLYYTSYTTKLIYFMCFHYLMYFQRSINLKQNVFIFTLQVILIYINVMVIMLRHTF